MSNERNLSVNPGLLLVATAIVLLGGAFLVAPNFSKSTKPTQVVAEVDSIDEIGWRPMVKGTEEEKLSGVTYVTISINGLTNDVNSYRHCYVNLSNHPAGGVPWRRNSQTGMNEVYVVMKTRPRDPAVSFFVMRDARILRADK